MITLPPITLRPKPLHRPPTRPHQPRQMTPAEFQPLLSKFPTLDFTWPAAVRAAWLLRHPVHTAMEERLGASEWWVQFAALRQLAQQLDAEADAQKQAATG